MTFSIRLVGFSLAVALVMSSCGGGRSVEAFCDAYTDFIETPNGEAAFATDDPSGTKEYFENVVDASEVVARAAPDEIKDDAETMEASVRSLLDALKDVDYDLASVDPSAIDLEASSEADESTQAYYLANCEGTAAD